MTKRYNYVIGDVQGCFEALKALLKEIRFDPDQDFIWFAGDLVARGENSVGALRFIKKLADRGAAATVLGNHDLTLIAGARGLKEIKEKIARRMLLTPWMVMILSIGYVNSRYVYFQMSKQYSHTQVYLVFGMHKKLLYWQKKLRLYWRMMIYLC